MGACNSGCAARACQAAPLQHLARRRVTFARRAAGDSPRAAAACADAGGAKIHEQPREADRRDDQAAQQLDNEPADEEPELPQPAPKRRGRKATGCVTRAQLLDALSTEREDQEAEADNEGAGAEGAGAAEPLEQAQGPAPKRRGRKATGMVTQAQLLAAKQQQQQDDGDEDDCDDADDPGSSKGEADGAVPQGSTQPRVVVVVSEITDEGSDSDAESEDGPAVVRKATGCVTKQQLLEVALREGDSDVDSDDPESSDEEEGGAHQKTGAGRRAAVVAPEDNGEAPKPDDELPAILTATAPTRRRGRKATGVVTKEQLLGALSACPEEEDDAEDGANEQPEKQERTASSLPHPPLLQATQSELNEVEEVADKAAELPAGWLCCRGHAPRWHGGI